MTISDSFIITLLSRDKFRIVYFYVIKGYSCIFKFFCKFNRAFFRSQNKELFSLIEFSRNLFAKGSCRIFFGNKICYNALSSQLFFGSSAYTGKFHVRNFSNVNISYFKLIKEYINAVCTCEYNPVVL